MSDRMQFFGAWLKAPLRVASVMPSSNHLAEAITAEITPAVGPVVELGPGTGVFTAALVARGVAERDLVLVEFGQDFADLLARRYPQARIVRGDAANLRHVCREAGWRKAGASVSGLPLLNMPPAKQMRIVAGVFAAMRPGGAFYQFTYGPTCPVRDAVLDRLGLQARRIGGTFLNLPPAAVYKITRKAAN